MTETSSLVAGRGGTGHDGEAIRKVMTGPSYPARRAIIGVSGLNLPTRMV